MISTIHIKNIGIIDDITIDFNQGFNVLTGETGAGKTLIIDALGIICGGRFSKEMIRRGEEHSYIEACMYLPEHTEALEGNIIVSREIYANGRNLCKINGRLVTVTQLKEFMQNIINIHGQNDNQTILEKASHIGYLDSFIADRICTIKEEYKAIFMQYQQVLHKLENNYGDDKEKERKLDLLRYQQKEIKIADLKIGEDSTLEEQRNKMLYAEKIAENLNVASQTLGEQTIDGINTTIRCLEKIEAIDETYKQKLLQLKNIYYDVQELSRDIEDMKEDIYFNEEERNQIEERLDLLFSLKRKYGNTIEEVLKYEEKLEEQIEQIESADEINKVLKKEQKNLEEKMYVLAVKMHEIRIEYGKQLAEQINQELEELEMKNAKFEIQILLEEQGMFQKNGLDNVEFLIKTNIGEEAKPLIKIASGGEMSRIMLAIKSVLAQVDRVPILIFDEIDTGISGKAAKAVSEKLKNISIHHQVLCVTHQASIAARGDFNYYICKEIENDKTKTKVTLLDEQETIKEIARIASGEITPIALKHAEELRRIA